MPIHGLGLGLGLRDLALAKKFRPKVFWDYKRPLLPALKYINRLETFELLELF